MKKNKSYLLLSEYNMFSRSVKKFPQSDGKDRRIHYIEAMIW